MKKVFNASLLAATVAFAFAANAADVAISPVLTVTNEAVLTNTAITPASATVVIYNRQELSAGDKVSLTFPKGTVFASATINKGDATASFSAPVVVAETASVGPKITYELLVGNPLTSNSKIEVVLDATYVPKAGVVVYEARDGFTDAVKDTTGTGTGTPNQATLITTAAQEIVSLKTPFNAFVERLARITFTANKGSQTAVLNVREPAATVKAAVVAPAATNDVVVLKADGHLGGIASFRLTDGTTDVDVAAAAFSASNPAAPAVLDTVTFAANALVSAAAAAGTNWTVSATPAGGATTIPLRSFTLTRKVTYEGIGGFANHVASTEFAAGKFQLDATVVNVPYLPVGYAHLAPVVEITNMGSADAQISVEAVGKTGTKYAPVVLTKTAKKEALTSIFESDLAAAFNLPKGSNEKLSVTFVIDADEKNVSLAPYYTNSTVGSVINVVNDQYKK